MGKLMGIKFRMIPWSYLIGNHMCRSGFISEPPPRPPAIPIINVIKSDGLVKIYDNPVNVSALMMEFPDHKVCSSDSLYIGQKISPIPEHEQLQLGHNYFLLPTRFFHSVLTFVTIASFAANSKMINSNCQIFDIQKTESGFLRIRVRDDFISRLMSEAKVDNKIAMMINNNSATYSNIKEEKEEEEEEEGRSSSSSSRSSTNKNKKKKKKKKMMMMMSTNSSSSGGGGGGSSSSDSQVCTTPQLQKEYKQLVLIGSSRRWKPKLEMIRETRNGEKKSSTSSRKVVLIPASFRRSINKLQKEYKQLVLIGGSRRWKPKLEMKRETRSGEKKSSTSSRKVILIPASFRRRINKRSSSNSTTTTNHKMKKKSSQIPSESPSPHRHHLPVPPSSSSSSSTTTPPPAASKHKRRSSSTTPKLSS